MSGIGRRLIEAREARGLTLEDVERDTRISRRYLQALEQEQFDVIPAPVYARGFLRSYSQYVGLDPQEMLAMFPREDGFPAPAPDRDQRATRQTPLSPQSPARPAWRRPGTAPAEVRGARPLRRPPGGPPREPTIGIDIGVPAGDVTPARRLNTDPAAQTRSLLVAFVAIIAISVIVLLALFISRLGGDSDSGTGPIGGATGTAGAATNGNAEAAPNGGQGAQAEPATSGLDVTPGIVPDLVGQPVEVARLAIQEAGFTVEEIPEKTDTFAPGTVTNQAPAAGLALEPGTVVIISVSEAP
ncbi:MAG: hypothetical protein Kow0010_19700 [Dehalococcoidia bacterium]